LDATREVRPIVRADNVRESEYAGFFPLVTDFRNIKRLIVLNSTSKESSTSNNGQFAQTLTKFLQKEKSLFNALNDFRDVMQKEYRLNKIKPELIKRSTKDIIL
jgi:hypothetical protein